MLRKKKHNEVRIGECVLQLRVPVRRYSQGKITQGFVAIPAQFSGEFLGEPLIQAAMRNEHFSHFVDYTDCASCAIGERVSTYGYLRWRTIIRVII